MYCFQCGEPVKDGALFCPRCGANLNPGSSPEATGTTPEATPPAQQARPKTVVAICPNCGAENAENSKYCYGCGHELDNPPLNLTPDENSKKLVPLVGEFIKDSSVLIGDAYTEIMEAEAELSNDSICPFCEVPGCQPLQKNETQVKQSGYSLGSACCGWCLLGPFGLLCGLLGIKQEVKITNETWWICQKCGKQHIALDDALKKWDVAVSALIGSGFSGGIAFIIVKWLDFGFFSFIMAAGAVVVPAMGLYEIHKELSRELGKPLVACLTPARKKESLKMLIISMILALAVGLLGIPLLGLILGE